MLFAVLAAAAAVAHAPVPIIVGGDAYAAAVARAQRYEADSANGMYRLEKFYPAITPAMVAALNACGDQFKDDRAPYTIIVSFAQGHIDALYLDAAPPTARCVADRLATLDLPAPVSPDFAEEMRFSSAP